MGTNENTGYMARIIRFWLSSLAKAKQTKSEI